MEDFNGVFFEEVLDRPSVSVWNISLAEVKETHLNGQTKK